MKLDFVQLEFEWMLGNDFNVYHEEANIHEKIEDFILQKPSHENTSYFVFDKIVLGNIMKIFKEDNVCYWWSTSHQMIVSLTLYDQWW